MVDGGKILGATIDVVGSDIAEDINNLAAFWVGCSRAHKKLGGGN